MRFFGGFVPGFELQQRVIVVKQKVLNRWNRIPSRSRAGSSGLVSLALPRREAIPEASELLRREENRHFKRISQQFVKRQIHFRTRRFFPAFVFIQLAEARVEAPLHGTEKREAIRVARDNARALGPPYLNRAIAHFKLGNFGMARQMRN